MSNNKITLVGFLGDDAKSISKEGKSYVILNLATRDSYPIKGAEETSWQEKDAVWHDVFVFRPLTVAVAKTLKKRDKVEIIGTISYKLFKDEDGYNRKQAFIVGKYVGRIEYNRQESLFAKQIVEDLASSLAA